MSRPAQAAAIGAALALFLLPAALFPQVFVRVPSGTSNHLRAVDLRGDSLGLIAGDNGTILRTSDGGLSWSPVASGTASHLLCVSWLSPSTAVAAGYNGLILRSADAGLTWSPVPSGVALPLAGSAALDSLEATIVGYNGVVLRTTDGGASWTTAFQQGGSNHLGVAYAGGLTIVASGSYGRIVRTIDGGATWSAQSYGTYTLNDVDFADSLRGVAVGGGGTVFLRTVDGGAHWTPAPLGGTFDDLDHAPDGRWIAAGIGVASSTDGGAAWTLREPPARFRAVAAYDSGGGYLVAGDNGIILRTALDPVVPPPPELSFPADGDAAAALSPDWQREFSVRLSWREYAAYFPDSVRVQVGVDPGFSGTPSYDLTFRSGSSPDTARIVSRILPGRTHYWRVRTRFDTVTSPWSGIRSFVGSIERNLFTVRDIQAVHPDSLLLADSLGPIARERWALQASPLRDSTGFLVVRAATDPADLFDPFYWWQGASAGMFFHGVDTGAGGPAWRGIKVTPGWFAGSSDLIQAFSRVKRGDLVVCAGAVSEDPWTDMNGETSFYATWLFVLDSAGAIPAPVPVTVADFHRLSGQNLVPNYGAGEPLEGGYVEFTDVTVHSAGGGTGGTFNVTTRDGVRIETADYSRWFTLRSHRDPGSAYQAPFIGRHIDTLRGYIGTTSGDQQSWSYPRYRVAPVTTGDIVFGPPTGNAVRGSVFYDFVRDGVWMEGEVGWGDWKLFLGGLASGTLTTGPDGSFDAGEIDSGSYALTIDLPEGWFLSTPGPRTVDFTLGLGDTIVIGPFGIYWGWERISGTVFEDLNENGAPDAGEPGLAGVRVRLAGAAAESRLTGSDGSYLFDYLDKGMYTVTAGIPPGWEQIVPAGGAGYEIDFREYDQHVAGRDFSLRRTPLRTKLAITVRDSGNEATRDILFGTRPGASYGVWGADTSSTSIDFSEGEFEIPPQIFGLFDARFVDPRGGIERFGEGTWTDVREYRSASQVDSFRIDFQPGLLLGGGYPMRFFWSRAEAESSWSGPVTLGDSLWIPLLDMKARDSLVVTDTLVGVLTIVAEGPVLRLSDAPDPPPALPAEFALRQNYPNPFNPETRIGYDVPVAGRVTIRVYDLLGREVAELVDGVVQPGRHFARWAPSGLPSGAYFCRMTAGPFGAVRKVLLVR